jgi:hypothetical protein
MVICGAVELGRIKNNKRQFISCPRQIQVARAVRVGF